MHAFSVKKRTVPLLLLAAFFVIAALLVFSFRSSAEGEEIRDFSFQTIAADTIESESTTFRFVFSIGTLDYTRVGFVASKTNENPTVGGVGCTVYDTDVAYSAIYADGVPVPAPEGRYWVAVKLTDVPNADFDTPIYLNAFVEDAEGIRYATAKNITVCHALGTRAISDEFTPILRFLVASDVHYADAVGVQDEKFEAMLSDAYAYADGHEKYTALDGAFIVGDIAHRGTETSLNRFFTDFYRWTREGTEAQAVLGNHEFSPSENRPYTVTRYLSASGYESADRHIVISGYHFILMSPSHYEGFNNEKIAWLETELAAAAAADPTGKKPIFVFQHHPAFDTVYGSEDEWGVSNLNPVFAAYPQVVDFSGHSHFPINDPRSVWQGTFTEFNTGSCREWGMDIAGVSSKTHFAADNEGGWTMNEFPESYLFDPGKYYIVEVNAASRVLVRAFDLGTGDEVIEPIFLSSVGDPAKFEYTDARKDEEEPPRFAPDAEVTTLSLSGGAAEFEFPRTVSGGYVQHYRCEVRRGEELVNTVYRLDDGFLFPAPATLKLPLSGLEPETEYVVTIIPVTSWENEGEPLVFDFVTREIPIRVFSAVFGEDGAAQDAVSGAALTKRGNPTTVLENGNYYAVFDGDDSFEFYGIAEYYSHLTSAFTFETYLCMDSLPASGVFAPFSNQEGGGFGYEYDTSGHMDFWIKVNGEWISAGETLPTGEWTHLVATFDGSTLILYVNGAEAARTVVSGTPATPNTDHVSIGADSKSYSGSENYAPCKIAAANVYRVAKTAGEVAELYAILTD